MKEVRLKKSTYIKLENVNHSVRKQISGYLEMMVEEKMKVRGKHFGAIHIFTILIVMFSQVYKYFKLTKLYTLNTCIIVCLIYANKI